MRKTDVFVLQLLHAMMAVSALSLAHHDGVTNLNALQHYQQVTSALQSNTRSEDDLSSDVTFLTHLLLLLYDVSSPQNDLSQLLQQSSSSEISVTIKASI